MLFRSHRFGEEISDGRLTEPFNNKVYQLREAILLSKQLGRPLSQEEMKEFEMVGIIPPNLKRFGGFLLVLLLLEKSI